MSILEILILILAWVCLVFGGVKLIARDLLVGVVLVVVGLILGSYSGGLW